MFLIEFYSDSTNVMSEMRATILDILTPLSARGVESVSLKALMRRLDDINPGIVVDRDIAMTILNPDVLKMISKVEGDRVYLDTPSRISSQTNDREAEKNKAKVSKMATSAAKKRAKS